MTKATNLKPPAHLKLATRRWWLDVVSSYELEQHHVRLLTLAGEAWDRAVDAREALEKNGTVYMNRFKEPRPRPEVAIERDSRIAFARLLRELALDVETPDESRPPVLRGNGYRMGG